MSGPNFVLDKTFKPTAAIGQYRAVVVATGETCTQAGTAGLQVLGICQDNIDSAMQAKGRTAGIRLMGASRAIAGAPVLIGARLVTDNQGRLVTATASTAKQNQVGIALDAAGAANDQFDVLLTPGVQIDT